jgi:hypothetical protein
MPQNGRKENIMEIAFTLCYGFCSLNSLLTDNILERVTFDIPVETGVSAIA